MNKTTSTYKEKQNFLQLIGFFIIYLMVGALPHIYKYTPFSVGMSEKIYFKEEMYADLYMLSKSHVFLALVALLLIIFAYQCLSKQITFIRDKVTYSTIAFAAIIGISSVTSQYQDIVYWGAKDRFEGMWVWIAYLVVFTIVRHYAVDKKFVERSLKIFVFSASLMAVFGIMQIFGYDIYTEGPLRWLCFPKEIAGNMSAFMVTNETDLRAVGALFNSNYFGVYVGLAALVALGFSFVLEKGYHLFLVSFVLLYGGMVASSSEASLLGFSVALFFFMLAFGESVWKRKNILVLLLVFAIVIDRILAMNLMLGQSGNALWIYIVMIFGVVFGLGANQMLARKIDYIDLKKYGLIITISTMVLIAMVVHIGIGITGDLNKESGISSLSFENNVLQLRNMDGTSVILEMLPNGLNVYDKNRNLMSLTAISENVLSATVEGVPYTFEVRNYENGILILFKTPMALNVFYDGQTITYVNPVSGFGQIESPDRVAYYFEHGSAFTNRAYLWSTYLPIVQKNLVLGTGVDTYLPIYPQNDYFGKTSFYYSGDSTLIDKPHSLYIDVLLGMGVAGFVLVLSLIVRIGQAFYSQIFVCSLDDFSRLLALVGLVMLFVAGIFNDSVLPITMLMSCLCGMGLRSDENLQ